MAKTSGIDRSFYIVLRYTINAQAVAALPLSGDSSAGRHREMER